ncbi:MAG: PAS domain-containing protein [Calditrichae bacterium]|nr:PAS domain-containing protein [Calditrichia bacterium]
MNSRAQSQNTDVILSANEQIDLKQYALNYVIALSIIGVFVTIAFAAVKFILPNSDPFYNATSVVSKQEALVQQIAFQVTRITQAKEKQQFATETAQLKESVTLLQDYHQGLLYGSDVLGLEKLESDVVKDVYFHPSTNLDKLMTDFFVNAKLIYQLPMEKVVNGNEHSQRVYRLASNELPALLQNVKKSYVQAREAQSGIENGMMLALWLIVMSTIFFAGFFILRPLGNKLFNVVEKMKKSRYQMLALKKKVDAEKSMLEKSAIRNQSTIEVTNDAMMIFSSDTNEIKINKKFEEIWDLPALLAMKPEADKLVEAIKAKIRNINDLSENIFSFNSQISKLQTANIILQDGKYLECYIRPLMVGEQVIGKAWSFLDVTRHILLAKKYAEQSRRYLDIINSMADGVVATDANGKLLHYNPAAEELLGISSEAGANESWYRHVSMIDPQSQQPVDDAELPFLRATFGENVDEMDLMVNAKDHEEGKFINASGRPIKDQSGHVTGGVVIIRQKPKALSQPLPQPVETADSTVDQFLENVNEGVFFIDPNLQITGKRSKALERMFGSQALQHQTAIDFFKDLISPELVGVIDDYLKLIFHSVVTDRYVEELNPIREIDVNFDDPENGTITRHMEFAFSRIIKDEKVDSLMVTVRDITQQVASVKKLRRSQAKIQKQIDLLFRVIHVDPSLLEKFIDECASEIAGIHLMLKKENFHENLGENLQRISRALIGIKENSAFLDLRIFEEKAGKFEKLVLLLQGKTELTESENAELNAQLDELHNILDEVKHIVDHLINKLKVRFRGKREEECRRFLGSIESYVQRISREAGKKVQVDFSRFNALEIPFEERQSVRDVLTELLKKVVNTSIESPRERKTAGKTPTALIQLLSIKSTEKAYEFTLRDDGKGMSMLNKPAEEAMLALPESENSNGNMHNSANGLVLNQQFFGMHKDNENNSLSTDFVAVESKVKKMGGKIHAFSQRGEFTEFYISLPNKNSKTAKDKPIIINRKEQK